MTNGETTLTETERLTLVERGILRPREGDVLPKGVVGVAAANPMARGMEMMVKMQRGFSLPALTPAEAIAAFPEDELVLMHCVQKVRVSNFDDSYRRVDYGVGWHLIPETIAASGQLRSGYLGTERAPAALLDQLFAAREARKAKETNAPVS